MPEFRALAKFSVLRLSWSATGYDRIVFDMQNFHWKNTYVDYIGTRGAFMVI